MKILIIEDEKEIVSPLQKSLQREGYAVDASLDGKEGYEMALYNDYDCILLDLNLPSMDGIDIARKLREESVFSPILMLTARNLRENIWEGFENGTDDYLTKPFDYKELLYRIKSLLKRNSENKKDQLKVKDLSVDLKSLEVKKSQSLIELNNKEFGILEYLLRNRGRVVSSEELLEHVWDSEIDILSQTVRTNIKTLRKKIDPEKEIILTINKKGYVIR